MLLYTIMPLEAIFPPGEPQTEFRQIKGGYVELNRNDGELQVSRLISTDPSLYLHGPQPGDKYHPGS